MLALDQEDSGWTPDDGPKEELATFVENLLKSNSVMLDDYFSLKVNSDGCICTVPYLLGRHWQH